jgi:hypothetical protein
LNDGLANTNDVVAMGRFVTSLLQLRYGPR